MTNNSPQNNEFIYRTGDLAIETAARRVEKDGQAIRLTPLAFDVLVYMAENRGRVVEKQELFNEIWRDNFVSDNALTRVVREIRHSIGDDAAAPTYIETVPKKGYRFIAEVLADTPHDVRPTVRAPAESHQAEGPAPALVRNPNARSSKTPLIAAAAVLGLAVVVVAWYMTRGSSPPASPPLHSVQLTNWTGLDNYPALSPDGNSIAYSSDRTGDFEIYVRPLAAGANELRVTAGGGQNLQPSWSPDGQMIAFHSRSKGGIWAVPATGGTPRQVADFGSKPAWSPDGKTIVFQSASLTDLGANHRTIPPSVLWTVPASGGEPRQITQRGQPPGGHGSPSWSRDGRWIVFNVEDVVSFAIWLLDVETLTAKQIVANAYDGVLGADGELLYTGLNGIWRVQLDSSGDPGQAVNVHPSAANQVRHLTVSADGSNVAYTMFRNESSIWSLLVDRMSGSPVGEAAPLFRNTLIRNTFPAFSPDGSRISYVSYIPGRFRTTFIADADGQNQTQIPFSGAFPHWMPDGRRIGSADVVDGRQAFKVFDTATGRQETILELTDGSFVRLSRDGGTIAYNAKTDGVVNVWLADLATGDRRQLTFDGEMMGFPAWSPDGKMLAVQGKRGDHTHIYLVPRDGGEPRQMTNEPGQSWVHSFSPDGSRIVFAGQRNSIWNLYWVSVQTGERKQLTQNTIPTVFMRYPAWSPAGDRIAFELSEVGGNIWMTTLKKE